MKDLAITVAARLVVFGLLLFLTGCAMKGSTASNNSVSINITLLPTP